MATDPSKTNEVILSLISHTNVGKTALARTLLRRDVGEVADRAHVTVSSEAYTLIEDGALVARLWDTPGFGSNLAKLAKRLRASSNPVGWILHQVWDRFRDESLWCSQEAIRNIKEDADVVLYLVDASQSPGTIGYVDLEMEILGWIGKPVLVFLNQTGVPDPDRIAREEAAWRDHLKDREIVRDVSTLDAFTRCWIQEHQVMEKAARFIAAEKKDTAQTLARAWAERNLAVFDQAASLVSDLLLFALLDTEKLKEQKLVDKVRTMIGNTEDEKEMEKIQQSMYKRLAERTASTVNQLITCHGIEGEDARELTKASRAELAIERKAGEGLFAAVGGAVSGLVGGLAADLISGGMTFGGGAIVGMLLGAGTTFALARGYNLTRTGLNSVRWTESHFTSQTKFIFMLYLAVAHFGRGRGAWQDPRNNPRHWENIVDEVLNARGETFRALWKKGGQENPQHDRLAKDLRREVRSALAAILEKLYPEPGKILHS